MKVVVIIGGLGSQMFKYAFYLSLKEKTNDDCYICTLPYHMMNMWNGYELKKVFGIDERDIYDSIGYKKDDNKSGYAEIILKYFQENSINEPIYRINRGYILKWREKKQNKVLKKITTFLWRVIVSNTYVDEYPKNYAKLKGCILYDEFNHTSDKYIKTSKYDLKKVFSFPEMVEAKNCELKEKLFTSESVAIHVRRSDHMYDNKKLFENGYFIKAINFIKSKVSNPLFCIFSEECNWCKNNLNIFDLDGKSDNVIYVDWNHGENSYKDMQLMTYCKHNILVISSFSWWGYYLSNRTDKIVCAPQGYWFEVSHHF